MTLKAISIFVAQDVWRIALQSSSLSIIDIDAPKDVTQEELAQAVAQTLQEHEYTGQGVILAVPSEWCLCASISTSDLPKKARHQTMLYRLEEKLPVPAEDMVADFISQTNEALGICLPINKIAPIIEALESAGIAVQIICPTALLAVQSFVANTDNGNCDAIIWRHGHQAELFLLSEGRPTAWRLLRHDTEDLALSLEMQLLNTTSFLHVTAIGLGKTVYESLCNIRDTEFILQDDTQMEEIAAVIAPDLLATKPPAWINLRRDQLTVKDPFRQIRKPLNYVVAAAMIFLVVIASVMFYRAYCYSNIADNYGGQTQTLFQDILPNQPMPMHVCSRLESEARKVQAVSGGTTIPHQTPSALIIFREVLRRLPAKLRFQILDIRIDGKKLYLEGRARSHAQADCIATALRKHKGFNVDQPRTRKSRGRGVDFTLRATIINQNNSSPKRPL